MDAPYGKEQEVIVHQTGRIVGGETTRLSARGSPHALYGIFISGKIQFGTSLGTNHALRANLPWAGITSRSASGIANVPREYITR